ncbi:dienelactone hydrolase family protein [Marinicauda algicola]|uniref:Dienelactone hydrolase family protein n=1 Tax=Marinicauda algicola TaxID=2029849 RepID=A0A4S2H1F9_9PROT|nr:dienelactone hydrolase family protein [Marinicauda algicola]TGY89012.1 dienelactone hydrolase family protein [Marinicauda algicola]
MATGEQVTIKTPDGEFMAYQNGEGPAIVVIQEIFGVNQVMRDLTDHYAAQGFTAICPDLFWRIKPGIQLTDKTEEEWQQAFDYMNQFDIDKGVDDIGETLRYARRQGGGKAGAVGYCLGGLLAYLTACRTGSDATVGYYGVNIDKYLGEAKTIAKPLMLHIAAEDRFVDKDAQKTVMDALKDHDQVTLHRYEGVDHAFARPGGEHFDAKAAENANARTRAFFQSHLG